MGRLDSALITTAEHLYYLPHRRAHVADWLTDVLATRSEGAWVLDFGGGPGQVATELADSLGSRVAVVDVSRSALSHVPRTRRLRAVCVSPQPPLPFRTGTFAGIALVDVLHHVPDREATLRELVTYLQPGGVIAIVEFEPDRLATRLFQRFARLGGRRCQFQTREVLAGWLTESGLRVQTTTLDGLRYGVSGVR